LRSGSRNRQRHKSLYRVAFQHYSAQGFGRMVARSDGGRARRLFDCLGRGGAGVDVGGCDCAGRRHPATNQNGAGI